MIVAQTWPKRRDHEDARKRMPEEAMWGGLFDPPHAIDLLGVRGQNRAHSGHTIYPRKLTIFLEFTRGRR